uniref:Uncharacterized protein n=1 Tax=Peronospora matthiolae TaxID=2874970 RepID=A0AAV1UQA3_9STRA
MTCKPSRLTLEIFAAISPKTGMTGPTCTYEVIKAIGSTSPQLTPLRSATPAPDEEDDTGLEPDATEPDHLDDPDTVDHLANQVGFSVGSDYALADDASSDDAEPTDADVSSDQVRNVDTAESD